MKTKLFIVPLLCSVLLGGASEPQKIDLTALKMGVPAPKVEGDTLCFSAAAETAAAAALNAPLDFSQGGRIELEFLDEGQQSNPFPRLVGAAQYPCILKAMRGRRTRFSKSSSMMPQAGTSISSVSLAGTVRVHGIRQSLKLIPRRSSFHSASMGSAGLRR